MPENSKYVIPQCTSAYLTKRHAQPSQPSDDPARHQYRQKSCTNSVAFCRNLDRHRPGVSSNITASGVWISRAGTSGVACHWVLGLQDEIALEDLQSCHLLSYTGCPIPDCTFVPTQPAHPAIWTLGRRTRALQCSVCGGLLDVFDDCVIDERSCFCGCRHPSDQIGFIAQHIYGTFRYYCLAYNFESRSVIGKESVDCCIQYA